MPEFQKIIARRHIPLSRFQVRFLDETFDLEPITKGAVIIFLDIAVTGFRKLRFYTERHQPAVFCQFRSRANGLGKCSVIIY